MTDDQTTEASDRQLLASAADGDGDAMRKIVERHQAMVYRTCLRMLRNEADADTVARVFAMVENVDQNVGKLLGHLDRRQIAANTIVIFMVDNGPNTQRYVVNSRGKKNEVHDGGIRSPFFFRWPAKVQAGTRNDRIAAHIDVMPTLLDAAGAALPEDHPFDGRNILPLLMGERVHWPDRSLVLQIHRGVLNSGSDARNISLTAEIKASPSLSSSSRQPRRFSNR